jgi:hypothetical protein
MSPEQIQGKLLDGRSDLFSVGVVLYELVTGERPFQGEALSTIIYKIMNENPAEPRSLNPDLPEALGRIIQKALSKNPEDRYFTGQAFAHALNHYAESDLGHTMVGKAYTPTQSQEILPPLPSGIRRIQRAGRRSGAKKYIVGGLLAALACAAVGSGLYLLKDRLSFPRTPKVPAHEEKLPRPVGVATEPVGAKLYLDGKPVDAVTLASGDSAAHTVEARLGCLSARAEVRNTPEQKDLKLTLSPSGPFRFRVESDPAGAAVSVDGTPSGVVTPTDLERADCKPFTLVLTLEGREPWDRKVDPSKEPAVSAALGTEVPRGALRLEASSATIRFYLGDRLLGGSGQEAPLPEGEHVVRIVDPAVRGAREQKVTVQAGKTARISAGAFGTGRVFLHGAPQDDGKVYVDGTFLDDLPLNGTLPLAVGNHQFRVVSPSGREVRFSWNLRDGEQTRVVNFETRAVEER